MNLKKIFSWLGFLLIILTLFLLSEGVPDIIYDVNNVRNVKMNKRKEMAISLENSSFFFANIPRVSDAV